MRPSTSLGVKVLSSMRNLLTPVLMSRCGRVKSGPFRQEVVRYDPDPCWAGSALVAASLYDTFDFIAHSAFKQGREVLVHPLADKRLHRRQQVGLISVHPFVEERVNRVRNGSFEYRFHGISSDCNRARSYWVRFCGGLGYLLGDMREGVVQSLSGLIRKDVVIGGGGR